MIKYFLALFVMTSGDYLLNIYVRDTYAKADEYVPFDPEELFCWRRTFTTPCVEGSQTPCFEVGAWRSLCCLQWRRSRHSDPESLLELFGRGEKPQLQEAREKISCLTAHHALDDVLRFLALIPLGSHTK